MRIISVCLIAVFVVLSLVTYPVLAHSQKFYFPEAGEGQISDAVGKIVPVRWLPSHQLYFLIFSKEAISRMFQSSSAKRAQFDFVLSGKRLKEVYLLLEKGDMKRANNSLMKYSSRLSAMNTQLEKARSQNQDVAAIVAEMAEGFKNQEVLLWAISKKIDGSDHTLDQTLGDARSAFVESVFAINNIVPGLKDRFKTITDEEKEATMAPLPLPSPEALPSTASPSVRPKRIIY